MFCAVGSMQDVGAGQSGRVVYTRDFLLACSESPFCRVTPRALPRLAGDVPCIVRKVYKVLYHTSVTSLSKDENVNEL